MYVLHVWRDSTARKNVVPQSLSENTADVPVCTTLYNVIFAIPSTAFFVLLMLIVVGLLIRVRDDVIRLKKNGFWNLRKSFRHHPTATSKESLMGIRMSVSSMWTSVGQERKRRRTVEVNSGMVCMLRLISYTTTRQAAQ
jgi:hypothetical protein